MTRISMSRSPLRSRFICARDHRFRPRPTREGERQPSAARSPRPSEIRLTFSEGVEPKFSKVSLTGPGGAVPLGAAKTESGNQAVLIAPISKPLAAGAYKVHWQAVSVDTHHTQGTFEFTVKP